MYRIGPLHWSWLLGVGRCGGLCLGFLFVCREKDKVTTRTLKARMD